MEPKHRSLRMVVTAMALVGFEPTEGAAAQGKDGRSRLPAAVAKAIDDNRPGAEIDKVEVDKEGGITIYDIEFKAGQGEMDVTEDGTVLDVATLIEMKDVPEPAAAVIREASRSTTIKQLEKSEVRARIEQEGGKGRLSQLATPEYEYEAELANGGEVEVAAAGRIIKAPKSMGKSSPAESSAPVPRSGTGGYNPDGVEALPPCIPKARHLLVGASGWPRRACRGARSPP